MTLSGWLALTSKLVVEWPSSEPWTHSHVSRVSALFGSPPRAQQAEQPREATEEIVVERPEPEPRPPEPEVEDVVPVEDPAPSPEPEPDEEVIEESPEVADEAVAAASEEPAEESPTESGEDLNVRIEGLRTDYPAYYENIISQISRCLRWREGGNWETTIYFAIDREGSVHDIDFVARSGDPTFDYAAMGAVECAGRGVFGPLPEDLPYDRFPVRFRFRPQDTPQLLWPLQGSQPGVPWATHATPSDTLTRACPERRMTRAEVILHL